MLTCVKPDVVVFPRTTRLAVFIGGRTAGRVPLVKGRLVRMTAGRHWGRSRRNEDWAKDHFSWRPSDRYGGLGVDWAVKTGADLASEVELWLGDWFTASARFYGRGSPKHICSSRIVVA